MTRSNCFHALPFAHAARRRGIFWRHSGLAICGLALLASVLAGCAPEPEIRRYTIDKPAPPPANRMLAAMIPHETQAWFFKLVGPDETVAGQSPDFTAFVKSVRFAAGGGKPAWTLPAGWIEAPGSDVRFATLKIATVSPPLEVSVTVLPLAEDLEGYTLSNVNRWRNQLQLPPFDKAQLNQEATRFKTEGGAVTLVNFVGQSSPSAMGRPALAGGADAVPDRPADAESPRGGEPLSYTKPDGWQPAKGSALSKVSFGVADGERRVDITVTDLAVAAGDRLANVNRWRGQIGLAEISANELADTMAKLPIDGETGSYVDLVTPEGAGPRKAILGVIVDHGNQSWFITLKGDAALAAQEKSRFEAFVQSLKFKD